MAVNLYDPYIGMRQTNEALGELANLGAPAVHQQMQFDNQQRQAAQPSSVSIEDIQNIHKALAGGADPAEYAMRVKMANAGHIPHVAVGLDPSHPISQAHPYLPQTALGPKQAAPTGQPAQGPEQPAQSADSSADSAQPEQSANPLGQLAQPSAPAAQIAGPAAGPKNYLTNGQLAFLMGGGMRNAMTESPSERAMRQYYEILAKNAGAEKVATTKVEGAKEIEGVKAASRKDTANIRAAAQRYAADRRVDAAMKSARGKSDPRWVEANSKLRSANSALSNIASKGMGEMSAEDVRRLREQQEEALKEIDALKKEGVSSQVDTTERTTSSYNPNTNAQPQNRKKFKGKWYTRGADGQAALDANQND